MIPPIPGPDPASRLFGQATPPDGAGPVGPDQWWPVKVDVPPEQLRNALNPLQYVPVVGTIYRLATGEEIPTTLKVAAAGITGGPMGAFLSGVSGIVMALITMKPDLSRPAVPAGMSVTGGDQGVQPVSPGTLTDGAYTTLATTVPDWLGGGSTMLAGTGRGPAVYQSAAAEYERSLALEKGFA